MSHKQGMTTPNRTASLPRMLTRPQAADALGLSEKTLRNWVKSGKGPRFIRLDGGAVRYLEVDPLEWLNVARSESLTRGGAA